MLGAWLNKAEGVIFNNWTIGEFKRKGCIRMGTRLRICSRPNNTNRNKHRYKH